VTDAPVLLTPGEMALTRGEVEAASALSEQVEVLLGPPFPGSSRHAALADLKARLG